MAAAPISGTATPLSEADTASTLDLDASSEAADRIIQATSLADMARVPTGQMEQLLGVTSRLLRSPGLQREIVKVMMEDEEVGAGAGG